MNLNTDYLQKKFGKNLIIRESLSKYSWFNLGGPADIFFRPDNKEQLKEFFSEIIKKNIRFYILGAGSNTLIRDSGIKGAVIKLGSKFSHVPVTPKFPSVLYLPALPAICEISVVLSLLVFFPSNFLIFEKLICSISMLIPIPTASVATR